MKLVVGQRIMLEYNAAKILGETSLAYDTPMAVEAVGADWAVLRDITTWKPHAYTASDAADWSWFENTCTLWEGNDE